MNPYQVLKTMTKFPILYHKGKAGKIYSWEIYADGSLFTVTAGTLNGAKTVTSVEVERKNLGKANETSLEDQAIKEAQAKWTYKVERKYSETIEGAQEELTLPMLAQDFEKKKKKLEYPVFVQPKLDGCRAMAKWEGDRVVLTSRNGKEWEFVPHINEALEKFLPRGCEFDGELYIHGKTFQEITRLIKKTKPETLTVEYHVYDLPNSSGNPFLRFSVRREILAEIFIDSKVIDNDFPIKHVNTRMAFTEGEVISMHDMYVQEGYEGAIVRVPNGLYLYGYRSNDLLKVKKFDDAEFTVVGYSSGVGRYEGAVCWHCATEERREFKVNPKTTISDKQQLFQNAESYIGQKLKVRFFGRSEDNIPRFPVGLGFRLEQDIG
ncbi:MAG: hypothetical protein ACRYGG_07665 [Janthinobacterium lividum]